jgi:hypothetical protein
MTLVLVGPVTIRSSSALKKVYESLFVRYVAASSPFSLARATVSGAVKAPAASVGPSVPSLPQNRPKTPGAASVSRANARAHSVFLPPSPDPVTGTVVSPPEMTGRGATCRLQRATSRATAA